MESLFNKVRSETLLKETPTQEFSCEYCEIFKSTYFEEDQGTAASESSEEKCTAFYSPSLSLCNLYFLFNKGKDTSAIPQPSVHEFVYVLPIFFRFHKCFHNFHQSKILLTNKFFSLRHVFLHIFHSMMQEILK